MALKDLEEHLDKLKEKRDLDERNRETRHPSVIAMERHEARVKLLDQIETTKIQILAEQLEQKWKGK